MIEYKIYQSIYNDMISGKKDIEFRLLNEKSNNIKKGDIIKFNVLDSDKYLLVKVTDKYIFDNIDELWKNKDTVLGNTMEYNKEKFTELFYEIFEKEKVNNTKIVGIKFNIYKMYEEV